MSASQAQARERMLASAHYSAGDQRGQTGRRVRPLAAETRRASVHRLSDGGRGASVSTERFDKWPQMCYNCEKIGIAEIDAVLPKDSGLARVDARGNGVAGWACWTLSESESRHCEPTAA